MTNEQARAPAFKISEATREAVPMLISIAGVSGSGKTYSALLLAAGLAGDRPVGFLDTENKRGKMYADDPGIREALPKGYRYAEMREPFAPERYTDAIEAFERDGCGVLVIDSTSHEWEGYGGCCDIAENNKLRGMPNWAKAKLAHKRWMNHLLASPMHIIMCLRAREKVKFVKVNGKDEVVPMGMQAIQEKNFTFEMTLSLLLDELTHVPIVTKCPRPLLPLFEGAQTLITKEMGERLRAWTELAAPITQADPEALTRQARDYAAQGTAAYTEYWGGLTGKQKKDLLPEHDKNKELARMADDYQAGQSTLGGAAA